MSMNIYLVRHEESLSNVNKTVHKTLPDHAIGLSMQGLKQAHAAGEALRDHLEAQSSDTLKKNVRLWTSPYKRTRQTAGQLLYSLDPWVCDVREHVLLCEQQFGLFDGLFDDELQAQFPCEHAYYAKHEAHEGRFWARMPLGESRFDVACRVHQAFGTFHRNADKHGIDTIIVVCHGVTLRAFVTMWCHKPFEWFDREPNPANAAIRWLNHGDDRGYIHEPK